MRKLKRNSAPSQLTPEFVAEQILKYKETPSVPVWKHKWLTTALLLSSSNKCAYCEVKVKAQAMHMEVDHFHPKSLYEHFILDWKNLVPSCKSCNGHKRNTDPTKDIIINPYDRDPKKHLKIHNNYIRSNDSIGRNTYHTLNLNNPDLIKARFKISGIIIDKIEDCIEKLEEYKLSLSVRKLNMILNTVKQILMMCQEDAIYSVACSTTLFHEPLYVSMKDELQRLELWNEEFEKLDSKASKIAFV